MSLDVESHAHAHAHKTGHSWVDISVAFCALFVSVVSLAVAILHGRTMEQMAEANARLVSANSWPFLAGSVGTDTDSGEPKIHMRVDNNGVGPAKIESAQLVWRGVAYRTDEDFLKACCGFGPASARPDSDLLMNEVLHAGGKDAYLEFKRSYDPAVFDKLQRAMLSRDFQLIVCYCSIFDECWASDLTTLSLTPSRVKSCERPKVPFDEGLLDRRT